VSNRSSRVFDHDAGCAQYRRRSVCSRATVHTDPPLPMSESEQRPAVLLKFATRALGPAAVRSSQVRHAMPSTGVELGGETKFASASLNTGGTERTGWKITLRDSAALGGPEPRRWLPYWSMKLLLPARRFFARYHLHVRAALFRIFPMLGLSGTEVQTRLKQRGRNQHSNRRSAMRQDAVDFTRSRLIESAPARARAESIDVGNGRLRTLSGETCCSDWNRSDNRTFGRP